MLNLILKSFFKKNLKLSKSPIVSLLTLLAIVGLSLFWLSYKNIIDVEFARASSEPSCQTVATSPSWNPFPINNSSATPVHNGNCQDMPMLSFFPVDVSAGNPRERNVLRNQEIGLKLYYNNGAVLGSGVITNPRASIQITRETTTKYRISATLSGNNTRSVNSSQRGGDLILNVPVGTNLSIASNSTKHHPRAIQRKQEAKVSGRNTFDMVADNHTEADNSNPLFSQFDGIELGSTDGVLISNIGLEPGFLNYGYFTTKIVATVVDIQELENNYPPRLPGQEITVVRGKSASFKPFNPTDPDSDYPIAFNLSELPSFCSLSGQANSQGGGRRINCQTDANTPNRVEFKIIPIDSRNLAGEEAIFIINVLEPGLTLEKKCYLKDTLERCQDQNLTASDDITYQIKVTNISSQPVENLVIIDNYNTERVSDITNISDQGQIVATEGKIFWNNFLPLAAGNSITVSFQAKISPNAKPGDEIKNTATATADGVDTVKAEHLFSLPAEGEAVLSINVECLASNNNCKEGVLLEEAVNYNITIINNSNQPAINVEVVNFYDVSSLAEIEDINPQGIHSPEEGKIVWQLGNIEPNLTKVLSFKTTTKKDLPNNIEVENTTLLKADNFPERSLKTNFPIKTNTSLSTPRSGGNIAILTTVFILILAVAGGYYYYTKNSQKTKNSFAKVETAKEEEIIQPKKTPKQKKHRNRKNIKTPRR